MAFCAKCGKEIEEGRPCPECDVPTIPVSETAPVQAAPETAPAQAAPAAVPFTRRFKEDPVGTIRDAWVNRRVKTAWLAIVWIAAAMFLETLVTQTISMIKYAEPFFPTVFRTMLLALTDPLPTVAALLVGAMAIQYLAAKEPDGKSVKFANAFAALGTASLPYAAALTLAIPVYAAMYILNNNIFAEVLSYYTPVVLYPLRIAALFLTLAVYRGATGNTNTNRLVLGGVGVLAVQALGGMVVGLILYLLGI